MRFTRSDPITPMTSRAVALTLVAATLLLLETSASSAQEMACPPNAHLRHASFMQASLTYSDGEGEVQLAPILDSIMEARRQSRVEIEHRRKMAEYRVR